VQTIPPDPGQLGRVTKAPDDNLLIVTLQAAYATAPASS
jgi:hypothetical protein